MARALEELFERGMKRNIQTPRVYARKLFDDAPVILNLGAGKQELPGAEKLDWPVWDADAMPIPRRDASIDQIHAYHFLEHCADVPRVLLECQRVLKSGGTMHIVVPYYSSQMQAQDLDHKSKFCEETWRVLFSNPYYNKNGMDWKFKVNTNVIMGVTERNLALVTELEKI